MPFFSFHLKTISVFRYQNRNFLIVEPQMQHHIVRTVSDKQPFLPRQKVVNIFKNQFIANAATLIVYSSEV